jgi:HSP20 family protein
MPEEKKSGTVANIQPRRVSMFQQMERDLEEMRNRFFDRFTWPGIGLYRRRPIEEAVWTPTADAYVADGTLVVEADLPGVKQDDISITVADNVLTVEGQRKEEKEVKEPRYYACERFAGAFSRSFALPEGVDVKAITADMKDGVLTVRVPLPTEARAEPIKIPVKS